MTKKESKKRIQNSVGSSQKKDKSGIWKDEKGWNILPILL